MKRYIGAYIKFIIIACSLIFISQKVHSQNYLEVQGRLTFKNGSAKEGEIKLYENGNFVETYVADRSGKFKVDLDINNDYIFEFSKDGYVTKKININTKVPEGSEDKRFTPIYFSVELFRQHDDVNIIVFTQPVGVIKFYESIGDFDYDVDYSTAIRNKIDKAEKELEQAENDALEDERQAKIEEQRKLKEEEEARKEAERLRKIEEEKAAAEARKAAEEEAKRQAELEKEQIRKQQEEEAKKD